MGEIMLFDTMEMLWGEERGSVIKCNRLDTWNGAVNLFYILHFLEMRGPLVIHNDDHWRALHYISYQG